MKKIRFTEEQITMAPRQVEAGTPVAEIYRKHQVADLILDKSTLTGSLDRLERRGLLTRELNLDYRRSFLVDLTTAGRRQATRVRAMLENFENALDGELSAADRKAFTRVMDAIARVTATDAEE